MLLRKKQFRQLKQLRLKHLRLRRLRLKQLKQLRLKRLRQLRLNSKPKEEKESYLREKPLSCTLLLLQVWMKLRVVAL